MNTRLSLILFAVILPLVLILPGCTASGVPQSEHDRLKSELAGVRSELEQAQTNIAGLETEKAALNNNLSAEKTRADGLEEEMSALQEKYDALQSDYTSLQGEASLTGATPAETVEKIIKFYHQTHVYDAYDLFVCDDMAADVWNMLKAQGISALIAVGNINQPITDIIQSDHSWVLAEVAPGEYLALETTGGRVVTRSDNALYYRGWSFSTPADRKEYDRMKIEYNTRVEFHNTLAEEERQLPVGLEAVRNELNKLILDQQAALLALKAEIDSLATAFDID